MKKKFLFVLAVIVLSQVSFAQKKVELTGNLFADSKLIGMQKDDNTTVNFAGEKKKSPLLAGALSLIFPGAGQLYNECYWKTAVFGAIEITAIVVGLKYDKKGDDQTNLFQNFADAHWSVDRYVDWTVKNAKNINPSVDPSKYKLRNSDGTVNWGELNGMERDLGSGYSHALPPYGDQQYYELIGKYPQYSHGWDDAIQSETDFHILSPNFTYYSGERGKANDYYNVAAKMVIALYVNHLISIVDAAWHAAIINKHLNAHASYERDQFPGSNEYIPKMTVSYSF